MKIKSRFIKKIYPILLLQCIAAIIIVTAILLIKYFSGNMFSKVNEYHNEYFEAETDVSSVMGNGVVAAVAPIYISDSYNFNNKLTIPLVGTLTSGFGNRNDPFTSKQKLHKGIDIAAPKDSDIVAVADGVVSFVGFDENGFGNYLTIAHNDNIKSLYGHCNEILVKSGDEISKGQIIAKVGNTGMSTGDHLHFEIRIDGTPVNPTYFIDF